MASGFSNSYLSASAIAIGDPVYVSNTTTGAVSRCDGATRIPVGIAMSSASAAGETITIADATTDYAVTRNLDGTAIQPGTPVIAYTTGGIYGCRPATDQTGAGTYYLLGVALTAAAASAEILVKPAPGFFVIA